MILARIKKKNLLSNGYDLVKNMCGYGLKVNKICLHIDNGVWGEDMYLIGTYKDWSKLINSCIV